MEEYAHVFVFNCENMRTSPFKQLRTEFRDDGRFLLGKNGVLQVAFGRTREEAYRPLLDVLASKLQGEVGVLFTNRSPAKVKAFFADFSEVDFARAGSKAVRNIDLVAGPLEGQPSSMVEPLRGMHLPVALKRASWFWKTSIAFAQKEKR